MAFPVPTHLPRKKDPDVSTILLSKMGEAMAKSLTFELASAWVSELDEAIRQTKQRVHDRVQSDMPAFEQQLSKSRSVRERLQSLSNNVDTLSTTLSHPETGLIPKLIVTLTQHATLAQEVADADAKYIVLSYLSRCKHDLAALTALTSEGRLPEAVTACKVLEDVLAMPPPPLQDAGISADLKRRYRTVKDRTQEQLTEAFTRGIVISPHEIAIMSSVQVRQSDTILSLSSILSSLSAPSLTDHLSTLRRDLITHYIDYILSQPTSVETSCEGSESKLLLFPAPPGAEDRTLRIDNLSATLTFLNDYLFPQLPPDASFPRTLCKPLISAVLNKLLVPSLPSSIDGLPQYLSLVRRAVDFEEAFTKVLGVIGPERDIKAWADGVASHYERQRRMELLDRARAVILREEDESEQFRVEVVVVPDNKVGPAADQNVSAPAEDDAAWGFGNEGDESVAVDEDGWGFSDESAPPEESPSILTETDVAVEEDDPWGWNEDEAAPAEPESEDSSVWDDPWGDESAPSASAPAARTATRLQRHVGKTNGTSMVSPLPSPLPISAPPPTPAMPAAPKQARARTTEQASIKESYAVSGRVKELMFLVEDILREAMDLSSSEILSASSSSSPIGSVIGQSAGMILELYRGLYPVTCADQLAQSPKRSVRFSNDCLWMSDEVRQVASTRRAVISAATMEKLVEGQGRLKVLGDSWFEDTIDSECQKLHDILDGANGFVETADQDHFDECESAVNDVLQDIRKWAQQLKPVLTKSKYYNAIGTAVDVAICRILQDVLALPDIPEVESQKLSELCRIFSALEGLFVEDPEQPSFVVAYVPSWLKFSYLSELLGASIADISYLFEEGALVDFEIEELVKLVRALFADTPLRANTVNKLLQGHPVQS